MPEHSHLVRNRTMSAAEAAELIQHGEVIGASGFTPAGYPKAIPVALAEKARREHAAGREFSITLYTGASTGDELDGELARAGAITPVPGGVGPMTIAMLLVNAVEAAERKAGLA